MTLRFIIDYDSSIVIEFKLLNFVNVNVGIQLLNKITMRSQSNKDRYASFLRTLFFITVLSIRVTDSYKNDYSVDRLIHGVQFRYKTSIHVEIASWKHT